MTAALTEIGDFSGVTDWVFDLDNTLYPRSCNLFAQIDKLITRYVMEVTGLDHDLARSLQKSYYRDHGTTLNGLMQNHGTDPVHYLARVHDIDYSPVQAHPELMEMIRNLPGRKFILTNGDEKHAEAVLKRLGGTSLFDGIFDIKSMGYRPKPHAAAYDDFFNTFGIEPRTAIMFDDLEKNLRVPHERGMHTVQVIAADGFAHDQVDQWELATAADSTHVHHVTSDLRTFLGTGHR